MLVPLQSAIIPSQPIESGDKTEEVIRNRGWQYWHQLFNARQLFVLSRFAEQIRKAETQVEKAAGLLGLNKCADFNSKLCRWNPNCDKTEQTFYNQALNTLMNWGTRSLTMISTLWFRTSACPVESNNAVVALLDARAVEKSCDFWITDPPYADAVNYHELKGMVKTRELQVLVGTDAASEGLNLQTLSTLINVDLPWNPTRLEQRKGRIQRIGQLADTILIYNMCYKGSVEDRVHSKLSDRLQAVFKMFGQIPEVLEDVWIAVAQNDEARAQEIIDQLPTKNPFIIKYEMAIPECGDWEKCAEVLDREEKYAELMKGW